LKEYKYEWSKGARVKSASIVFEKNSKGVFVFRECRYSGVNDSRYDLKDWEFIRDLAGEVLRLSEEEGKEGG